MTKRERKNLRRRRIRNVRRAKRIIARLRAKLPNITEAQMGRHNRLVEFVNKLVNYPFEDGLQIIEGSAECPECGGEVWLLADPSGWSQTDQPKWRRRRRNRQPAWRVDSYWGGIGECGKCADGFIAAQPDGQCHFYPLGQPALQSAIGNISPTTRQKA